MRALRILKTGRVLLGGVLALAAASAALSVLGTAGVATAAGAAAVAVSLPAMAQEADSTLTEMRATRSILAKQERAATKSNDILKKLCVGEKREQVSIATDTAVERVEALKEALGRGDSERVQHEVSVVRALKRRVKEVASEASKCIGNEVSMGTASALEVRVDPGLPDPLTAGPDAAILVNPPVISSPTS